MQGYDKSQVWISFSLIVSVVPFPLVKMRHEEQWMTNYLYKISAEVTNHWKDQGRVAWQWTFQYWIYVILTNDPRFSSDYSDLPLCANSRKGPMTSFSQRKHDFRKGTVLNWKVVKGRKHLSLSLLPVSPNLCPVCFYSPIRSLPECTHLPLNPCIWNPVRDYL